MYHFWIVGLRIQQIRVIQTYSRNLKQRVRSFTNCISKTFMCAVTIYSILHTLVSLEYPTFDNYVRWATRIQISDALPREFLVFKKCWRCVKNLTKLWSLYEVGLNCVYLTIDVSFIVFAFMLSFSMLWCGIISLASRFLTFYFVKFSDCETRHRTCVSLLSSYNLNEIERYTSDRFSIDIFSLQRRRHTLLSSNFGFLADSFFFGIVEDIFLPVLFLSLALFEQEAELATEDDIFDLHCAPQSRKRLFIHFPD